MPAGRSPAAAARSPTPSTGASRSSTSASTAASGRPPRPGVGGARATVTAVVVADACLVPAGPGRRGGRSRHRLVDDADRPPPAARPAARAAARAVGRAAGDGARLRLAAARAALASLVEATPEQSAVPAPDLIVVAGGAWAVAPGPADRARDRRRRPPPGGRRDRLRPRPAARARSARSPTRRAAPAHRPTSSTTCWRRSASVVIPAGIRAGTSAGPRDVHAGDGLEPSTSSSPAASSSSTCRPARSRPPSSQFRDTVRLGGRGRHFAVDVAGGPRRPAASTCATCRSACPTAPSADASCSRPGRTRSGSTRDR